MCVSICKHTHIVERTRGAGVSFPLLPGKTPWKQSQLSRPKLIQEFLQITRQETRCCSPLPPLLFRSPVNIILIRCVVRSQGKTHNADSYSNSFMTRVYLAACRGVHFSECSVLPRVASVLTQTPLGLLTGEAAVNSIPMISILAVSL